MNSTRISVSGICRAPILIAGLCLCMLGELDLMAQSSFDSSKAAGESPNGSPQNYTIHIAVDEVRVDAVVVDRKGKQITDLTADDFDLYHNGERQRITAAVYINQYSPSPDTKVSDSDWRMPTPKPSTGILSKEKVRRAIVFIVDDYSMSFEHIHYARMSIKKFVETQMQADDLIAIIRTSGGIGALQVFSSDKRELLSVVDKIRWLGSKCPPEG